MPEKTEDERIGDNPNDQEKENSFKGISELIEKGEAIWELIISIKPLYFIMVFVGVLILFQSVQWFADGQISALYLPEWLHILIWAILTAIALLIVSRVTQVAFGKSDPNINKATVLILTFSIILTVIGQINLRHFDSKGNPTRWINTVTAEKFRKPNNDVQKDVIGEYFIDAETRDTCRPASIEMIKSVHDGIKAKYLATQTPAVKYKWEKVFNETYSYRDANGNNDIWTDLKGYSIKVGDRLKIQNINKESNVVKLWVGRKNYNWIYADKIDGEAEMIITRSYSNTADKPIIIQIDGKGKARVILERKVPV